MTAIPIRNIYYLLCYAWNHAQESELAQAGEEEFTRIQDLLGHVLATAAARLISRGLDRSYILEEAAVAGIRGKLEVAQTLKQRTLWSARTWCSFDEFHHDILPNQILKASLELLLRLEDLDGTVRDSVRQVYLHLPEVRRIRLRQEHFRRVQIHRNNRLYDFALRLCRLLFESMIVEEGTGRTRFHDFLYDDARMGQLFEDFVFNFYAREQSVDRVSRPHIKWHDARGSEHDLARLPIMRTDVVLTRAERILVIDTKFYGEALKGWFGGEKVRSGHLYQVFSYLENLAPRVQRSLEGLLVYPAAGGAFSFDYRLKGRRIRVVSLDLSRSWQDIHSDLLLLRALGDEE